MDKKRGNLTLIILPAAIMYALGDFQLHGQEDQEDAL